MTHLYFNAPQLPEKWNGTLDATKQGNPCISQENLQNGSEDCLVLNVYTKHLPVVASHNDLRPVLFWIHGGGFYLGSSDTNMYSPDLLLTEDIIIVTINYRLGIFGLLSLKDPSLGIPGNAAFKDMVMALKWVHKNIIKFGGDPDNITIFGESSGGAAVHLLYLSELSKNLFHKAIAQSGSALNPWVYGKKGIQDIASVLGLKRFDEKSVYEYLMEKSAIEISNIQANITDDNFPSDLRPFCLVIESKVDKTAFLTDEPLNLMLSGKYNHVPFMIGYNNAEGMISEVVKNPKYPNRPLFDDIVPWFFDYQPGSTEAKSVAEKIKTFYYGSEEPSPKNVDRRYAMISDAMFIYEIYFSIVNQLKTAKAPIYFYRMSVETELNFVKRLFKLTGAGAAHADDIGYLFKHFATPEIKPGSLEDISFRRFVRLWTNFAKFGNPTPESDDILNNVFWKPVGGSNTTCLDIGVNLSTIVNPEAERMHFWERLSAESPAGRNNNGFSIKFEST